MQADDQSIREVTMIATNRHHHPAGSSEQGRVLARAWMWVALIPVFFFVGFAVGELLYAVLGYKPENDDAPLWVDLIASLGALAVTLVPCGGAVIYGRRGSRTGNHRAQVAMAIGMLTGVALVVLTALST
jgi:hypothetical protein